MVCSHWNMSRCWCSRIALHWVSVSRWRWQQPVLRQPQSHLLPHSPFLLSSLKRQCRPVASCYPATYCCPLTPAYSLRSSSGAGSSYRPHSFLWRQVYHCYGKDSPLCYHYCWWCRWHRNRPTPSAVGRSCCSLRLSWTSWMRRQKCLACSLPRGLFRHQFRLLQRPSLWYWRRRRSPKLG